MQVDGEQLRLEDIDQAVDGGVETGGIEILRQVSDDRALAIVRDSHAVAEHREQRLLAGHQVGLQEMLTDGFTRFEFEGFMNPRVLLDHGFFLDENGTQLAIRGEGGDGGFVNVPIVGAEPIKNLSDKGGIDCGVEFVGFHGVEIGVTGSQGAGSAGGKGDSRRVSEAASSGPG